MVRLVAFKKLLPQSGKIDLFISAFNARSFSTDNSGTDASGEDRRTRRI